MRIFIITIYLLLAALLPTAFAQEYAVPIRVNNSLLHNKVKQENTARKTTTADTLALPFFEDFAQYSFYPDSTKWVDYDVYINNTMGASPPSRGVATFDDLNPNGTPYDSFNNGNFRYADSLTSQPINLGNNGPGDSVYLSFFYQPQGNGFYPQPQDSLMLYMKTRYGGFVKVWTTPGTAIHPFKQVLIPITDSLYFHNNFQFRFVNIAALYWADAVWNVDYIKLDINRSATDTVIGDVAITSDPTFLLNDYTSMPWSQYAASPLTETVSQVTDSITNNNLFTLSTDYYFSVHDKGSGAALFTAGTAPLGLLGFQTGLATESFSIPTLPVYPANTKVDFESQFYLSSALPADPTINDTIVKEQIFDNYLAYDDGSAEKSYYLNLYPTLPGLVVVEYHLNHPDTLRGLSICFGKQIPFANNKLFSINIYSALAGINGAGADAPLYVSDLLYPAYADTANHFWFYRLDSPLVLPAGTFYAGTMQCAGCGSDSLYIGLDVNRIGSNHAYYNLLGTWSPSLISGALMMRPVFGNYIPGTGIATIPAKQHQWQVTPNPAKDELQFDIDGAQQATYHITDIMGHTLMQGTATNGRPVDISQLAPGMYLVNLLGNDITGAPQKIIKL